MALTHTNWINELESAVALHIETYLQPKVCNGVSKSPVVYIGSDTELPRPLDAPTVVISRIGGYSDNTGGMNVVSQTEQGKYEYSQYVLTVLTDRGTGGKQVRSAIGAELNKRVFDQYAHILKASIDALSIDVEDQGEGTLPKDSTMYTYTLLIEVMVLVKYTSVVL